MVANLVRLALAFEYSKRPLRREDITKHVFTHQHRTTQIVGHRKVGALIDSANVQLRETFGMQLVTMPVVARPTNSRTALGRKQDVERAAQEDKQDSVYALVSLLPESHRKKLSLHRDPHILGLLSVLASAITLNGMDLTDDEMLELLQALNVVVDERDEDPTFGNVPRLLDELKRQRYLNVWKRQDETQTMMYGLGQRAKVELQAEGLGRFVADMAGLTEQTGLADNIRRAFTKREAQQTTQTAPDDPE